MGKRLNDPAFLVQQGGGQRSALAQAALRKPGTQAKPPRRQTPLPRPSKPLPKKAKKKKLVTSGKVVRGHKLRPLVDDRAYLDSLRDEPCMFTGTRDNPDDPVEPMHFGNPGKGIKSDNEAGPVLHSIHALTHTGAGLAALIPYLERNPALLRDMFRAYLRERYAIWKEAGEVQDTTQENRP